MKNVHILPTDKPSRLYLNSENKIFITDVEMKCGNTQHIYITSDEEIKEGDWFYDLDTKYIKIKQSWENSHLDFNGKKIILTTDQDLIKDGVQAIDDEFLEWFVNNPSCEEVEVERHHGINTSIAEVNAISGDGSLNWEGKSDLRDYKIIIPKEEPKQETVGKQFYKTADMVISVIRNKETLEDITLEEVFGSAYCEFSAVENKLAILYRNQEQLLKAIKLLSNEK